MTTNYRLTSWGRIAPGKTPYDALQLALDTYGKTADGHQQSKIVDDYVAAIKSALPAHWNIVGGWHQVRLSYNAERPMTDKELTKALSFLKKVVRETDIRYFIEKHTRTM